MTRQISVGVIYRNYTPLNSPYFSFWYQPPRQIVFDIPKAKTYLKHFFFIYKKFGGNPLVAQAIKLAQKAFFQPKTHVTSKHDVLFFVGMLPPPDLRQPHVIDLEHVYSLLNFSSAPSEARDNLMRAFVNPYCRAITPLSQAAARTLEDYLGPLFEEIRHKVQVIYPAIPSNLERFQGQEDYSLIKHHSGSLNFLFIGKDSYGKGLQEVLPAFHETAQTDERLHLTVVSNTPTELIQKFRHPRIQFFPPKFSYEDVMKKLFLPSDIFIMPTHSDTFGMVYLEALSAGKPVIATSQFAIPEIVDDQKNGILLKHQPLFLDRPGLPLNRGGREFILSKESEEEIVHGSIQSILALSSDKNLLEGMKKSSQIHFQNNGKFTISKRNELLVKVLQGSDQ